MTRLLHILRFMALDDDTRGQIVAIGAFFVALWLLAFVSGRG